MIAVTNATQSLQVVLAGAKSTADASWVASFADVAISPAVGQSQGSGTVGTLDGTTNGVTAVPIMPAPAISPNYRRQLKSFNLNNLDTAAITVSVQYVDTTSGAPAGSPFTVIKFILQTGENATYEEGFGFNFFDVNGAIKSQAANTSAATSTAQAAGSQASSMASIALNGSSQASSLAAAIVVASVNSVSSQASSMAALVPASVSSQASSMAALVPASVSSAASLALLVSSNASLGSSAGWSTTLSKTKSSFAF